MDSHICVQYSPITLYQMMKMYHSVSNDDLTCRACIHWTIFLLCILACILEVYGMWINPQPHPASGPDSAFGFLSVESIMQY